MKKILVETKDLKKYFKTPSGMLHAVDGVNLSIPEGNTLGIVGESGCGKSTLGRTILKLTEPTGGEIIYDGENIENFNKRKMNYFRKKMQIVFQDPFSSLNPRMSVRQIIAEPIITCQIYSDKKNINNRVKELMSIVGLDQRFTNSYPHELDGGRRQRIGVARALAVNPKFIVCDEPVSALDVSIQAQILNLMMDLQESLNLTYMFITHDLSVVKHISDKIAVMYLGQCVELVNSDKLFENPLHPYTKALLNSILVPKINVKSKLHNIIKGEVPNPIEPKLGCRFASRCPYVKDKCLDHDVCLREIEPGHMVACSLWE